MVHNIPYNICGGHTRDGTLKGSQLHINLLHSHVLQQKPKKDSEIFLVVKCKFFWQAFLKREPWIAQWQSEICMIRSTDLFILKIVDGVRIGT